MMLNKYTDALEDARQAIRLDDKFVKVRIPTHVKDTGLLLNQRIYNPENIYWFRQNISGPQISRIYSGDINKH